MTMNCLEFRQIVGADPERRDAELAQHRLVCRGCMEFASAQENLSGHLRRALHTPVPDELAARVLWRQANAKPGWSRPLSLAAVLLASIGLGFMTYATLRPVSLSQDVIAHIRHEPELLLPASAMAAPQRVNAVLNRGGYGLSRDMDNVTHAGLCPFRGRLVPHLVMNVEGEAVSVLLLPHERVRDVQDIHEDGFDGVIVPAARGSIVIVAPREDLLVPVQQQLEQAVHHGI